MQKADIKRVSIQLKMCLLYSFLFMALLVSAFMGGVKMAHAVEISADRLVVTNLECRPDGRVKVWFSWQTASAGDQWLDISATPDNFVSPVVMQVGILQAQETSAVADGLLPKTNYYARVATQTDSGWTPSPTLSFTTSACDAASSGGSTGNDGTGGGGY